MPWTVIVPLTPPEAAKSRLMGATATAADHVALVGAIRQDTLAAVDAARVVARIVIVAPSGFRSDLARAVVVPEAPGGGLNPALASAAARAVRWWPTDGVAALVGDLPALRPVDLSGALDAASLSPRALVPDRQGTGTTMLTAAPGVALDPRFGDGSCARHRDTGAVSLIAPDRLRTDVDVPADLDAARALGLGEATAARLRRHTGRS